MELNPTAKIAIKKCVLKQYRVNNEDVVYLSKGAEFEIELFNPLQETVLCKIKFNNITPKDGGLVLRPGERVFLERYLDKPSKFKFDVYEVDDTKEVDNAIKNNGLITISFYKRAIIRNIWNNITYINPIIPNYYTCGVNSPLTANFCSTSVGTLNASSCTTASYNSSSNSISNSLKKETGIITDGNKSDQNFQDVDLDFQDYPFLNVSIKLMPDSQKVFTTDDIKFKKYCSECGKKVNQNDKFCSNCGSKL